MTKRDWALMTWQEVRAASERNPVVLVPAGTVETQGPFTYIGSEFDLAERLARDAAAETDSLVVPTLPYGWSPDFEGYAGTISLRPRVLAELYEDVARSIARHGFGRIMFVVAHIPNQPAIEEVAYMLRRELGIRIAWINPGALASQVWRDLGPDFPTGKGHGADPLLSMAAYMAPDAVALDNLSPNDPVGDYGTLTYNLPHLLEDFSLEKGGFGDATQATVSRGEIWYAEVRRRLVEAILDFSKRTEGDRPRMVASESPEKSTAR
jgi:creatinine amidohydrolase